MNLLLDTARIASLCLLLDTSSSATPAYRWKRDQDSLALEHMGKTLWKFHFKKGRCKPFFHPLATMDGHVLTADQPADHVWHHGLWYSFKFLNGVNFWEENPQTGLSDGITQVTGFTCNQEEWAATFSLNLEYANPKEPDQTKQKLLREQRTIHVSTPDQDGTYTIHFEHHFQALQDVTLGRTPLESEPNGKPYGGYAGFSLRQHPMDRPEQGKFITPDSDPAVHGAKYRWLAYVREQGPDFVASAIFDHPRNPRHPAPWYISKTLPFYSPSFLFDSDWSLRAGERFTQRYRVKIFSKDPTHAELEKEWQDYANTGVKREVKNHGSSQPD